MAGSMRQRLRLGAYRSLGPGTRSRFTKVAAELEPCGQGWPGSTSQGFLEHTGSAWVMLEHRCWWTGAYTLLLTSQGFVKPMPSTGQQPF